MKKILILILLVGVQLSTQNSFSAGGSKEEVDEAVVTGSKHIDPKALLELVKASDCKWVSWDNESKEITNEDVYNIRAVDACSKDGIFKKGERPITLCIGNALCKHKLLETEFRVSEVLCEQKKAGACENVADCIKYSKIDAKGELVEGGKFFKPQIKAGEDQPQRPKGKGAR